MGRPGRWRRREQRRHPHRRTGRRHHLRTGPEPSRSGSSSRSWQAATAPSTAAPAPAPTPKPRPTANSDPGRWMRDDNRAASDNRGQVARAQLPVPLRASALVGHRTGKSGRPCAGPGHHPSIAARRPSSCRPWVRWRAGSSLTPPPGADQDWLAEIAFTSKGKFGAAHLSDASGGDGRWCDIGSVSLRLSKEKVSLDVPRRCLPRAVSQAAARVLHRALPQRRPRLVQGPATRARQLRPQTLTVSEPATTRGSGYAVTRPFAAVEPQPPRERPQFRGGG